MVDLFKKKAEISLALDRPDGVYHPGERVGVTVQVVPHKDLAVRGGLARLAGTEWHLSRRKTAEDATESFWGGYLLHTGEEAFLGAATLPKGVPQQYTLHFDLPTETCPSFNGDLLRVEWNVRVCFDRKLARDLEASTLLHVRLPAHPPALAPGEYGQSSAPAEVDLAFSLPGLELRAGETLHGELCVLPHQDFEAKVRVKLTRTEDVPMDLGNQNETSLVSKLAEHALPFTRGQAQRFPFEIAVPAGAPPSIETPNGAILWELKGILDRSGHADPTVRQPITVYPGA